MEKLRAPSPVLELLGQPLHLAVNPDQQAVDDVGVAHSAVDRHRRHDPRRSPVSDPVQSLDHLGSIHRPTAHRFQIEIDNQVRNLQQLGPGCRQGSGNRFHHWTPAGRVSAVQIITPALSVHNSERGRL